MPGYPIPPWIGGGPNPSQVLLEGLRTGSQIALEQQRMQQQAQESAMRIQLAQQEAERQKNLEQQRLELTKAYHQQQIDLGLQRLGQASAMNQQKMDDARQKVQLQNQFNYDKMEQARQRYMEQQALRDREIKVKEAAENRLESAPPKTDLGQQIRAKAMLADYNRADAALSKIEAQANDPSIKSKVKDALNAQRDTFLQAKQSAWENLNKLGQAKDLPKPTAEPQKPDIIPITAKPNPDDLIDGQKYALPKIGVRKWDSKAKQFLPVDQQ